MQFGQIVKRRPDEFKLFDVCRDEIVLEELWMNGGAQVFGFVGHSFA